MSGPASFVSVRHARPGRPLITIAQLPQMPARQAAVDAVKAKTTDRFELQQALMPYEHLLPPSLRGRNERIDERFPQAAE